MSIFGVLPKKKESEVKEIDIPFTISEDNTELFLDASQIKSSHLRDLFEQENENGESIKDKLGTWGNLLVKALPAIVNFTKDYQKALVNQFYASEISLTIDSISENSALICVHKWVIFDNGTEGWQKTFQITIKV